MRPKVRPRTGWRDYISDFAWYYIGVEPAELSEIADLLLLAYGGFPPSLHALFIAERRAKSQHMNHGIRGMVSSGDSKGEAWVGHGPPDFWLAPCLVPPVFSQFLVQVRLVDMYSR